MPRESIAGDRSGVNLGEDGVWTIRISCGMLRVKIMWFVKIPYGIQWRYCVRMGCGVEFGRSPNLVQLEFVKFVSCTRWFPKVFRTSSMSLVRGFGLPTSCINRGGA